MIAAIPTLRVMINVNTFNFEFDQKLEKAAISPLRIQQQQPIKPQKVPRVEQVHQPNKPISTYEPRVTQISLNDSKVNEVIGWIMILTALFIVIMFCLNLNKDIGVLGFAVPLTLIIVFFLSYINWLSMKFFVNS